MGAKETEEAKHKKRGQRNLVILINLRARYTV
jgi:hypothetical protein